MHKPYPEACKDRNKLAHTVKFGHIKKYFNLRSESL